MSQTLHDKGLAIAKQGDYAKAITIYTEAISNGYITPDLLNDRAVAYFHTNDKLSAFQDFMESKNLQPDYSYRYASLAFIKQAMGDTDGAIADYEHALTLDPTDAVCLNNLGLLQEQKGYKKEAQVNFDQADQLNQKHAILEKAPLPESDTPVDVQTEQVIEHKTYWALIKSVFTSKQARQEFIHFLKNGFKA